MKRRSHSRSFRGAAAAACAAIALLASACGGGRDPAAQRAAALSSGANCSGTSTHVKHINQFACATCHPQGGEFGFSGTLPGGLAVSGTVTRVAGQPPSCTVSCHAPSGTPAPVSWNAPGPLACTACHAPSTLPAGHPTVSADATRADCEACHLDTAHMEGTVRLVAHAPEWTDTASPSFHAVSANSGLGACRGCHGQDLAGNATVTGCGACHDADLPPGIATWKANCVMCHGGTNDQTGAPPAATWGNGGDAVRVGAHTRHLAGSAIAPAFDCDVCHAKPADALSPGHVDGGTAEVAFGGVAAAGAPIWNRTSATCAVYCHGATLEAGGTDTAPSWNGGPVPCGACHGTPPLPPHPALADLTGCVGCHPQTMDATGTVIAPSAGGKHLDGILQASGTHALGWMDTASADFHAYAANRGLGACQECHGAELDGVGGMVSIGCNQCHGATWRTNCTMCHGGFENATGAPPEGTWGNASAVAVGAHTTHVGPNPISGALGCIECHSTPTDALSPGHIGGRAEIVFGGPVSGLAGGRWDLPSTGTPTCSSTYCHGQFTRGNPTNAPSWTATAQAACGSCHPARPLGYLHNRHQRSYATDPVLRPWWPLPGGSMWITCDQCHFGIAESVTDAGTPTLTVVGGSGPALHVDGKPDVVFGAGGTYAIGAWEGTCSAMACHPGETKGWPR